MPVFELYGSRKGRRRAFVRAQLPLTVGATFVTAVGAWAAPSATFSLPAVFGLGVILSASALFAWLPWERWHLRWLLILAGMDVLGVAFMRLAYFDFIPAVSTLAIFPAVWLAYAFGRWAISLAIGSCFFVTLLPPVVNRSLPESRLEVAAILMLPVLVAGLAAAVGEAARQLTLSQQSLRAANGDLAASLRRTEDNEHLVRTIVETVDVAIAFYDPRGRLIIANELARRATANAGFDLEHQPHAGPHVWRADNKTPIEAHDQIIPRALRGDLHNHEMEWIGPAGNQRAILAAAQQVLRADGDVWGTLIAAHDVTDLARSLQVRDDFIATVSHELRTPLTTIVAYIYLLEEELTDYGGIVPGAIASMKRGATRLQARIEELLASADERNHLDLQPVDIAALLRTTTQGFAERATALGLTLDVRGAYDEIWATADHRKLEQVVENLLSNALKYTPAPGVVTVSIGKEVTLDLVAADQPALQSAAGGGDTPDSVVIEVSDTGRGMTSDELGQAFDPFWRADSAREDAVQGVGLGLGLVKNIVTAHRGSIAITSELGVGTHVTLTLPRRH